MNWPKTSLEPNRRRTLLRAAWLAPISSPPQQDAGVVFSSGRIEVVGNAQTLTKQFPDAEIEDAGNAVILPGLVNAHSHLELSKLRQVPNPGHLADWILQFNSQSRDGELEQNLREGVEQSIRFGVTSVGDISKFCSQSRAILKNGPLRIISYGEVIALAQRRNLLDERFAAATDLAQESNYLHVGVTPHAPYTVEPRGYGKCLEFAKQTSRPIATHLAETPDEKDFLANHSGPLRRIWDALGAWDDSVPKYSGGPIRFARDLGLLDYPTLLAHVNYCDDEELAILAAGKASVVYCPRTHAYFSHAPHRWREMMKRKINVAIGTDSCASSPDLNLVDDLRLLHRLAPEVSPEQLWKLATTNAAQAIGHAGKVGTISAGANADFTIFAVKTPTPLQEILQTEILPVSVWIAGQRQF